MNKDWLSNKEVLKYLKLYIQGNLEYRELLIMKTIPYVEYLIKETSVRQRKSASCINTL